MKNEHLLFISALRSGFDEISKAAEISDSGGERRNIKGDACEVFVENVITPLAKSLQYTIKRSHQVRWYNSQTFVKKKGREEGTKELDIALFNQKVEPAYGIEVKDYGDSTQFSSSLTSNLLIKSVHPNMKFIFVSMHFGST